MNSARPSAPDCAEIRDRFMAWLDGELAPDEAAAVEAHLPCCAACRAEAEAFAALHRDLCVRAAGPEKEQEAGVRSVLETLRTEGAAVVVPPAGRPTRALPRPQKALRAQRHPVRRASRFRASALAAAGLLAAAGAVLMIASRSERPAAPSRPGDPPPAEIARAEPPAPVAKTADPPDAEPGLQPPPIPPPPAAAAPSTPAPEPQTRPDASPPLPSELPPAVAPLSPAGAATAPPPDTGPAPPPTPPPPATVPTGPVIASIEAAQGKALVVAGPERIPAAAGAEIRAGQGLETRGYGSRLAIRHPDGTRVELRGDAAVRQVTEAPPGGRPGSGSGKAWVVTSGTLVAEVARQPYDAPFLVRTPTAEATVLGTAFRIACSPDATQLEVREGKVRLTRTSDRASVTVPAGHFAVSTAAKGDPLVARTGRVDAGLLALYAFDEREGDTVHEAGDARPRLDLRIGNPDAVRWLPHGLAIRGAAQIASAGSANRIATALRQKHEFTLEAWVRPDPPLQQGPAGILLLAGCDLHQIAMLGYGSLETPAAQFRGYLRTAENEGDAKAWLAATERAGESRLVHFVFTRGGGGAAHLYVDGIERASGRIPGEIPACTVPHRLLLGAGLDGESPWLGDVHLAAIYGRPLSPDEVRRNCLAGCGGLSCTGHR